mmetsp:Transcript_67880/g.196458  ORF Transcript_67880/g.196458 Transcript_67880/m.196458 type:complete len:319 (+) Transcript_67880:233-1189(+)
MTRLCWKPPLRTPVFPGLVMCVAEPKNRGPNVGSALSNVLRSNGSLCTFEATRKVFRSGDVAAAIESGAVCAKDGSEQRRLTKAAPVFWLWSERRRSCAVLRIGSMDEVRSRDRRSMGPMRTGWMLSKSRGLFRPSPRSIISAVQRFTVLEPYPEPWASLPAAMEWAAWGKSATDVLAGSCAQGRSVTFSIGSLTALEIPGGGEEEPSCSGRSASQKGTSGLSLNFGYSRGPTRGLAKFCMSYSMRSFLRWSFNLVSVMGTWSGRLNSCSLTYLSIFRTDSGTQVSSAFRASSSASRFISSFRVSTNCPRVTNIGFST